MQHASAARQAERDEMTAMTQSLIVEFAGVFPAGRVISCVARMREHLIKTGVRAGLAPATEAAVRAHLTSRMPAHQIA